MARESVIAFGLSFDVIVAFAVFLAPSVLFWGRGLIRGSRGNLYAGAAILAVTCVISVFAFGVFGPAGLMVTEFGFASLVLSLFASPKCPLDRGSRLLIGLGCLCGGCFFTFFV